MGREEKSPQATMGEKWASELTGSERKVTGRAHYRQQALKIFGKNTENKAINMLNGFFSVTGCADQWGT